MKSKKAAEKHVPQGDNISGIFLVVVSLLALFLFLFGIFSREYRLLAVTIPVALFTVGFLCFVIFLSWEYSKKQI